MESAAKYVIGIDLGTSNCAVSLWRDGRSQLIPAADGANLTPSVVGLDDDGNVIIGARAKARLASHPHLTIASFKRYMGTERIFPLGSHRFRAEELSALLLGKLKTDAEVFLGAPVDTAIITVPAYFNDIQRKAVKSAGKMAGLRVERLLNEPTAAALAYGLANNDEQKFLVFDLGGGTFDVSIIDMFEGVIEVRASSGDVWLGGDDFTESVRQWMLMQTPELRDAAPEVQSGLTRLAEEMKCQLTQQACARATLAWQGQILRWELDTETFAGLCDDLLVRLKTPVLQALHDAQFSLTALDHVVLVGGATRMPLVRQSVARMFGRFPRCELHPDEVVALGAGVQCGFLLEDRALDDIVLTDVMPYSLGVEVARQFGERYDYGHFLPLIERNTFVPVSIVKTLSPLQDNQEQLAIHIYQGESRRVKDNILLGSMALQLPPRPADESAIEVRFTYTLDGILEVECRVNGEETTSSLIIEQAPGQLSEQEIRQRLVQLAALKQHPRDIALNRQLLGRAARRYEQSLGERRNLVDHYVTQFELALEDQDARAIVAARRQLEQLLDGFNDGLE